MKKLFLSLLVLGVAGCMCQADVLIYKLKMNSTETGGRLVFKNKITGWLVLDVNNGLISYIKVQLLRNEFEVFNFADGKFSTLEGEKGKLYTVVSFPGIDFGNFTAVGLNPNTPLVSGPTTSYFKPKALTITGSDLSSILEQNSGTLTYDQVTTTTQNGVDGNFKQTVNRLAQALVGQGLTQLATFSQ